MSIKQESSETAMVLTSITGYCRTFVEFIMQKRSQMKMSLFQYYKGLGWLKEPSTQEMLFQQINILP